MIPENLPFGTPLEGANAGAWAVAMLEYKKFPVNNPNVYSLAGWFRREGGGGSNNPMNTTLRDPGALGSINSDGVQNYDNPADGIKATWDTLDYGYPNIVASFKEGVGLEHPNNETAIELGRWSGGGYTFIEPIAVPYSGPPIAPIKPNMYYSRYDNTLRYVDAEYHQSSEYILVREYDEKRPHQALHEARLKVIRNQLHVLATRLEIVIENSDKTSNDKFYRPWRLSEIRKRVADQRLL